MDTRWCGGMALTRVDIYEADNLSPTSANYRREKGKEKKDYSERRDTIRNARQGLPCFFFLFPIQKRTSTGSDIH